MTGASPQEQELEQAESQIVTWLTQPDVDENTPKVIKNFPTGQVEEKLSVPARVAEYKAELQDLRDTQDRRLRVFNRDVEGKRLTAKKGDVAQIRKALSDDLKAKTTEYLEKPLVLENVTYTLELPHSPLSQGEFFHRLVEAAEGQRAEALRTAIKRAYGSVSQLRERWPRGQPRAAQQALPESTA